MGLRIKFFEPFADVRKEYGIDIVKDKSTNSTLEKQNLKVNCPRGPRGRERAPSAGAEGALWAEMPVAGQRRPALPRADPAVPSALGGLTSGFGMGPGVPPLPWPLTIDGHSSFAGLRRALGAAQRASELTGEGRARTHREATVGRARPISTARLRRSRALHLRPINLVVYEGPYRRESSSRDGLPA